MTASSSNNNNNNDNNSNNNNDNKQLNSVFIAQNPLRKILKAEAA